MIVAMRTIMKENTSINDVIKKMKTIQIIATIEAMTKETIRVKMKTTTTTATTTTTVESDIRKAISRLTPADITASFQHALELGTT